MKCDKCLIVIYLRSYLFLLKLNIIRLKMSTESSDTGASIALSLVAQFDDINRLNNVLNDGASEECKYIIYFRKYACIVSVKKWRYK